MHKIYTCKYIAIWSKFTHISKSIFNLRSHANSVHISILKGTHTCCTVDINVLQQTACLVVNPITVGNFAFLFNCTPVGRTSDSMMVPT